MAQRTWNSAGRGRKQCPGCGIYIGAGSSKCETCGHTFKETTAKPVKSTEVRTFKSGGRGRKQCSGCGLYVGSRVKTCACGSTDFASNKAAKVTKTYQEPGTGRKKCPACKVFIGARTQVCVCGHEFAKTSANGSQEVERRSGPVTVLRRGQNIITTPRGSCPVRLTGTTEEEVRAWAEKVQFCRDDTLAVSAYFYWASRMLGIQQARIAKVHLDAWAQETGLVVVL